jgi:hypothetical protein
MPHTDPISLDDLDALLDERSGPCVSIFLPTSRLTRETEADRIRLKNFRAEAFERLMSEHALRRPDAEALLEPLDGLLEDDSFWPYLGDGLAVFLSPTSHAVFRVGQSFEPRIALGERFVIKPLLPLLSGDGTYYVLALSGNAVSVYSGSRAGAAELPVGDLPTNMADALNMLGREGSRHPNKLWQGDEGEKILYRKYFRAVDRALKRLYAKQAAPLVLAGVDSLMPIFREVCSSRQLVPESIPGNPEELTPEQIHERAWPIVQPILDAPRQKALEQYRTLQGTTRVTDDLQTILTGAFDGRVQTLFLEVDADIYGTFDPESRSLAVNGQEPKNGDIELYGRAARWVFQRGGEVFGAGHDEIPGEEPVVALMRY